MYRLNFTHRILLSAAVALLAVIALPHLLVYWDCEGCMAADHAKSISDSRTAVMQMFLGVAGALTIYFTWRNFILSREGRTSDNFIKAVEQLGSLSASVRAGGVFGLGRLLRSATVKDDYWPIMDLLTTFVVERAGLKDPRIGGSQPAPDVQAALDVLARRDMKAVPHRSNNSPVDLHGTDLAGAWMAGGHFECGFFEGSYLGGADLSGAHCSSGNFIITNFDSARLSGAQFTNANLKGATFEKAILDHTDFGGADLSQTSLAGATSLNGANFKDANLMGAAVLSEQLVKTSGNANTKIPAGVDRPPSWG